MKVQCCNCGAILGSAKDYRDRKFDCPKCKTKNAPINIRFESTIRFECYNCRKRLIFGPEFAEQTLPCPDCGTILTVPKSKRIQKQQNSIKKKKKIIVGVAFAKILTFLIAIACAIYALVQLYFAMNVSVKYFWLFFTLLTYSCANFYLFQQLVNEKRKAPLLMQVAYAIDFLIILGYEIMHNSDIMNSFIPIVIIMATFLWKITWIAYFSLSRRVKEIFVT